MTIAPHRNALLATAASLALVAGHATAGQNYSLSDIQFSGYLVSPCAGVAVGAPSDFAGNSFGFDPSLAPSNCHGALGSTVNGSLNGSANAQWQIPIPGSSATQSAAATAQAGYGWSKLNTSAQAIGSNQGPVAGMALGGFADMLTIMPLNPALAGTEARLNFTVHVSGQLKVSTGVFDGPYAQVRLTAYSDKLFDFNNTLSDKYFELGNAANTGTATSLNVSQDIPMSVTFKLGETFQMGVYQRAVSWIWTTWPYYPLTSASADFSNTFSWQGVSSVTVGNSAVAFTMSSASGVNWLQAISPVPEPGTGMLMLAGLLGLGCLNRRARGQPNRRTG